MAQGVRGPRTENQWSFPAKANETLTEPYLAVQVISNTTTNLIQKPANPTSEIDGIAQKAVDKNQEVDIVYFGETWCQMNGSINWRQFIVNNSSSGKLELYSNATKNARSIVGKAMQTVDNANVTKIAVVFINLANST